MTNRLELNWSLDGFVDEQRYYCSETPIDSENLPAPKVILDGEARSYIDTDVEVGKTYYVRVGSVKNGVEKLSLESMADVGDKYFSNVVMISNMSAAVSGSLINDVKEHIFTLRTGSAAIVDDPNAYDSKALFVDGGVQSASSSDWNFDGKFTIETRFKFASHQMYGGILCCASDVSAWLGWNIIFDNTSNNLRVEINQTYSLVSSISLLTSTYYDICLERDENNLVRLYVNGAVVASGMYVGAINTAGSPLLLGIERTFAYKTVATYDAVRITKGVARYVGAYTPNQKPYFEF